MTTTAGRPVIERLTIRNYRVLQDITFDKLTPLTVLFGPNGSGKSTVFDFFDCAVLRRTLDAMAVEAGFSPEGSQRTVVNRIVVEELEAWFFGDINAVVEAYAKVPSGISTRAAYRDSDAIRGGTAEAFERLLNQYGYHRGGLAKTIAAAAVAPHMDVEKNTSRSFQVFRDGVRQLVERGHT